MAFTQSTSLSFPALAPSRTTGHAGAACPGTVDVDMAGFCPRIASSCSLLHLVGASFLSHILTRRATLHAADALTSPGIGPLLSELESALEGLHSTPRNSLTGPRAL
jgi:hypothetical protein